MTEERTFVVEEDGQEFTYSITELTAEIIKGADWEYSKVYTQCLMEGIATASEMYDILTRRGIIGPEYDQRASELEESLYDKLKMLDEVTDPEVKRELALEASKARSELYIWNNRANGPMNNTAENFADSARLDFMTSAIVLDSNGKRVWATYADFQEDSNKELTNRARYEVMLKFRGLQSDFLTNTPEAIAMREATDEISNRLLSEADDDDEDIGDIVDTVE